MGKFKFTETGIEGMFVVEPTVFETLSNNDKALIRPLTSAYHLSNTKREEYLIDFDYKTDNEINGNPISNVYTDWGSEPFNQFNTKISDDVADSVTQ